MSLLSLVFRASLFVGLSFLRKSCRYTQHSIRCFCFEVAALLVAPIDSNAIPHYYRVIKTVSEPMMTVLTVTARGQVTFRKDVLQHLGIKPGDKIELALLSDGRAALKAARPSGSIDSFLGLLEGRTSKVATIEEINEATAQGWSGTK